MKQVTLYSAHKQQILSTDLSALHQFKYLPMQDMLPIKYSDEIIIQDQVEKIRLPIEKYCWQDNYGNRREILAAFDEGLREIIGCFQEKFKRDVQTATDRRVKQEYNDLLMVKDELKTLYCLSVWDSLVWSIRKLWRRG